MSRRSVVTALALLSLLCSTLGTAALGSAQVAPEGSATLIVDLRDFRNDGGSVRCTLFASREGYPSDASRAVARAQDRPRARRAACRFEGIAPGAYAVSVHHDEDGDGVFDTGIFGIPLEGVGASRDAHGTMGPPSFEDARIDVPIGESHIVVHLAYPM